jgi:hypothetical protein
MRERLYVGAKGALCVVSPPTKPLTPAADLGPDHSDVRARLINGRLQGSIFARDALFYFEPSSEHMRAAPASHVIYPATAVRAACLRVPPCV